MALLNSNASENKFHIFNNLTLLNKELAPLVGASSMQEDSNAIEKEIKGKSILVTGAAGTVGSELVRAIAGYDPRCIILMDQAETPLHDMELEMKRDFGNQNFVYCLGDIRYPQMLHNVFKTYKPEIIFHAAAYKHISMVQNNPCEGVMTNVAGVENIARLAVENGTSKFIFISTDKALNPTSVMGYTKRVGEIYCQSFGTSESNINNCLFISTRFGNVLGSTGSVVPIFRDQILRGDPLTLTHPDVMRYFLSARDTANLILYSSVIGKGGEIFTFDTGNPVKIADLAREMIKLSGRTDIEIKYTGLKPGEKLFEEIVSSSESYLSTPHPKIKIAKTREYPYKKVKAFLDMLIEAAREVKADRVLELLPSLQ